MDIALSIVIPAYNEAARIGPTLDRTLRYVGGRPGRSEILVVDDGSSDETAAIVQERARRDPRLRVVRLWQNRGKGRAVREGATRTKGARVLVMDADLATPIEELEKLEAALDAGADVAIGSRALHAPTAEVRQDRARKLVGRLFNLLVRAALVGDIQDTQCGFKLFSRRAAMALFGDARVDRYAFDVEILMLARGRYRVVEVPVSWYHMDASKVSVARDGARMLLDLVRLRLTGATRRPRGARRADAAASEISAPS